MTINVLQVSLDPAGATQDLGLEACGAAPRASRYIRRCEKPVHAAKVGNGPAKSSEGPAWRLSAEISAGWWS